MTDLVALTAELIDIPSVSFEEAVLADYVEAGLRAVPWLQVERVGDNVVARTQLGRPARLVLAGHLDTVPPNGNERARIEGDVVHGLGAVDMKGGLAILLDLARSVAEPAADVTWAFYRAEEVAAEHNGLGHLLADRPDLLAGDAAVIAEPTAAALEAGCQGTLRMRLELAGTRAHTARPWMGRNAIHRLGEVLGRLAAYDGRRPVVAGLEFREALQAVAVEGGVAGNVVPDRVALVVNHRFAPDRTPAEAEAHVRDVLGPLEAGDVLELTDLAPAAAPALDHPLLAPLAGGGVEVRAKLGWTDVARFAAAGVPALNFGPGDPTMAHTAGEHVRRDDLERVHAALGALLRGAADPGASS